LPAGGSITSKVCAVYSLGRTRLITREVITAVATTITGKRQRARTCVRYWKASNGSAMGRLETPVNCGILPRQMIRYNAARGKASPGDSGAGRHSDRNERRSRAVAAHWTEFEYLQPATYRSAARHPRPGSSDPDSKPLLLFRH